ncbi:MAG: hypothetical protein LQ350_000926 [Teloschistes chrysophthalmus]|nr:MAG: hypothetical protein LQ350_000926 [Niorma chrysophthalma]
MERVQQEKRLTDIDDTFNPVFSSLQSSSEDSGHRNYMDPPSPYRLKADASSDEALKHIRTANTISISPELFEKLYLSPQTPVKGNLRNTFGNPTPVALLGFVLACSPLACELMGWRGAGGNGSATLGSYYFVGGMLMTLGGILEFFLGNTFAFVVFCSFGGFWFTLGSTLTPFYNAYGAYAPDPTKPYEGLTSEGFHASFAFFLLFMGFMSLMYLICALRTNIVFVTIFFGLFMCFVLLTGSYWQIAMGQFAVAAKLQIASGAFAFLACLAGWWIFFAQMLASVDFPYQIPVGDISHLIRSGTARAQDKERFSA